MLTATEVRHIQNSLHNYLDILDPDMVDEARDAREAIELLDALKPVNTEDALQSLAGYENEYSMEFIDDDTN